MKYITVGSKEEMECTRTLAKECGQLKTDNEDLERRLKEMYTLYLKAEDLGSEARDEVASLKDALEMKQVSNDAIDKEAGGLREEVAELKERNKTALGRCASTQRDIDQWDDICKEYRQEVKILKHKLETFETSYRMVEADRNALQQRLYAEHYPLEGQIKAEKERDALQEKVDTLQGSVKQRDDWLIVDGRTIQRLFNQVRELKAEKVRTIVVPLVAMI
jgi:chromosome segregation ATPase